MILSTFGREYYALTITTTPVTQPTDWEASFDGGTTWVGASNVNGNSAWLVRGTSAAAGSAVAVISRSVSPLVRLTTNPELVVRGAPGIQLT